ncbi:hypothetical protein ON010_g12394 [Phytophthora cinnamomi]|nr:hypothetical protein ON010_g12394 [Phytophthora cinnamomi]
MYPSIRARVAAPDSSLFGQSRLDSDVDQRRNPVTHLMKAAKGYAKLPGAATASSPSHIGCKEYLMTVASRLYFSSFYRLVYFFMIASSLVCVVWNAAPLGGLWADETVFSAASVHTFVVVATLLKPVVGGVYLAGDHRQRAAGLRGAATDDGVQEGAQVLETEFWCASGTSGATSLTWLRWVRLTLNGGSGGEHSRVDELWYLCDFAVMSLVSVAMYFNEEGVLGELEEVATDSVLALRNAVQYVRLAIFLKNRSDRPTTIGKDIDFEDISMHPDDEREMMLDAESGMGLDSDDDEEIQIV